jgi:hypothetical protein
MQHLRPQITGRPLRLGRLLDSACLRLLLLLLYWRLGLLVCSTE